tara:strand:+ start:3820 stop:4290 length:471 start_codon:yes stop_codon:yes gene_type:complete
MGFKLGSEKRRDASGMINSPQKKTIDNTPIIKKDLEGSVLAEANNDGTIFIDPSVEEGTEQFNTVVNHEIKHMNDMESGRAAYGDNWVMWEGNIYFRKEIDGVKYIDGPAGRLEEGDERHPWEESAMLAEGLKTYDGIPIDVGQNEDGQEEEEEQV